MLRQTRSSSPTDKPVKGTGMSMFLASVAVLLSTIALGITGFVLIQNFQLQQSLNQLSASVQKSSTPAESSPVPNAGPPSLTAHNTATVAPPQSTQPVNTAIQPGQFVQPVSGGKAEVELVAVKRIPDPETGKRNVVNVQMRIRVLEAMPDAYWGIGFNEVKAIHPETSQTYESYDRMAEEKEKERAEREGTEVNRSIKQRSTNSNTFFLMKPQSSVDAYVWLVIPEGIDTIDLLVPHTETFKNVPIAE